MYRELGDRTTAQAFYEKSMTSYIDSVGPEHPEIIGVYVELAELLDPRESDRAKSLFLKALEIANKRFGASHRYVEDIQRRYGAFLKNAAR